jgi:ABC-type transport system involved in multi-copper enzyme maturation permease subunit
MIRKELNLRMRERMGWVLPSLYLTVLAAVAILVFYMSSIESFRELQGADVGVPMFIISAYAQMIVLLLLAPIFSAGAITIEKEQRTLPGLLTSLLTPLQIWWGKFVASLLFVLLLIVLGLPILSLAFAFGGIGPWEVAMSLISTVVAVSMMNAIGLYWSSVFRRTVHATAVTYATVIVLGIVTLIIFGIRVAIAHPKSWETITFGMKVPLYFNPLFFLTMGFVPARSLYPEWVRSLVVFVLLTLIASLLTLWNLRRSGESV